MNSLSQKLYLELTPPSEGDARDMAQRIQDALFPQVGPVRFSPAVLRKLYPLCESAEWRITASLARDGEAWRLVNVEMGDARRSHVGLAVDLGSTSVVMQAVDVESGRIIGQKSGINRQTLHGDEILSRIFYAHGDGEKIEELRRLTLETLQELMSALSAEAGLSLADCPMMVISGNTTMVHFLLGLDAFSVFMTPYAPVVCAPGFMSAADLGLDMAGMVYIYPSKSNYLGGDIISGAVALGLARSPSINVFLDIGTNGELMVGGRDFLVAGAGAAGPALEGGVIRTGMRAETGAVDHVSITGGDMRLSVIGGGAPRGICGSGIVDMIAEMYLEDYIDFRGRYNPERSDRIRQVDDEWACEYGRTAAGDVLWFYQSDIDQFLATKAAAYTMVAYMLNQIGLDIGDVSRFYLAGAFGAHIRTESGIAIGLYPDLPPDRIVCAGNSSLDGARALLLDGGLLDEIREILDNITYIQFGEVANFVDMMNAALGIPHLDADRYPTVQRWKAARRAGTPA